MNTIIFHCYSGFFSDVLQEASINSKICFTMTSVEKIMRRCSSEQRCFRKLRWFPFIAKRQIPGFHWATPDYYAVPIREVWYTSEPTYQLILLGSKGSGRNHILKVQTENNGTYIAMRTSKLPQVLISQPCHQSEESCSNLVFYWFKIKSSYEGSIFCPVVIDTLSSSWIIMANKGLEQVFIWRAGRHDPCLIGGWEVLGKTA